MKLWMKQNLWFSIAGFPRSGQRSFPYSELNKVRFIILLYDGSRARFRNDVSSDSRYKEQVFKFYSFFDSYFLVSFSHYTFPLPSSPPLTFALLLFLVFVTFLLHPILLLFLLPSPLFLASPSWIPFLLCFLPSPLTLPPSAYRLVLFFLSSSSSFYYYYYYLLLLFIAFSCSSFSSPLTQAPPPPPYLLLLFSFPSTPPILLPIFSYSGSSSYISSPILHLLFLLLWLLLVFFFSCSSSPTPLTQSPPAPPYLFLLLFVFPSTPPILPLLILASPSHLFLLLFFLTFSSYSGSSFSSLSSLILHLLLLLLRPLHLIAFFYSSLPSPLILYASPYSLPLTFLLSCPFLLMLALRCSNPPSFAVRARDVYQHVLCSTEQQIRKCLRKRVEMSPLETLICLIIRKSGLVSGQVTVSGSLPTLNESPALP